MTGFHLVADLCSSSAPLPAVGDVTASMAPRGLRGGEFLADTRTAGSCALLVQVSLPVALFAGQDVKVRYTC